MSTNHNSAAGMRQDFLEEYSAESNIRRYMTKTAGHGIRYLLEHDYGDIYLGAIERFLSRESTGRGLRILEFGCGAGMNLLHLLSLLERRGIAVDYALGTDFSPALVESARAEARDFLAPQLMDKVQFCVARNEALIADITHELSLPVESQAGSFDLIFGVNTIRYCHRLKNEQDCADGVYQLLAEGGVCISIDMNSGFPAFRSRFRNLMTKPDESSYLPSLDEYARPFAAAGLEVLRKENFCWIPHSAGHFLTTAMKLLTPLLNGLVRRHAMRSLVISRKSSKPAH